MWLQGGVRGAEFGALAAATHLPTPRRVGPRWLEVEVVGDYHRQLPSQPASAVLIDAVAAGEHNVVRKEFGQSTPAITSPARADELREGRTLGR